MRLSKRTEFCAMVTRVRVLVFLTAVAFFGVTPGRAQQGASIAGDYAGALGPIPLKLHIVVDGKGALSGTMDSPSQGATAIPCADFHVDGQSLSFSVPLVHGVWKGTVSADYKILTGTWDQGQPQPLVLTRDTFVPAAKPSAIDGTWLGSLAAGGASLRVQLNVKSDAAGQEFCTLDSLDQHAMGLECTKVQFAAPGFSFDVPVVNGHWQGKLSDDGKALNGTWSQGSPMELNFARQATAITLPPTPPPTYDAAMPPVSIADLQGVLDKDFAEAKKSGQLAPATGGGVSIAVVQHGVRRVFSYGTAHPDSIFEIGSITKTFTGLILAQMVQQGAVKLDNPVRELLPAGTVAKPEGGEITLFDLGTQHSGLPRMPGNFSPADPANPYADYTLPKLYEFMGKQGVAKPANTQFLYSNLGFALLGQALASRAGLDYAALLKQQVLDPVGLHDTAIALSPEQQARFIPGHDPEHRPAHAWDLAAMAPAGAIRSTASDMLTYLEADLHPDSFKPAGASRSATTLRAALKFQQELRADAGGGMKIALAWLWDPEFGSYWHNGGTGGYSSFAFFNPKDDCAAVVLFNTELGQYGSFADRIGRHIEQRLAGKPAISLAN